MIAINYFYVNVQKIGIGSIETCDEDRLTLCSTKDFKISDFRAAERLKLLEFSVCIPQIYYDKTEISFIQPRYGEKKHFQ